MYKVTGNLVECQYRDLLVSAWVALDEIAPYAPILQVFRTDAVGRLVQPDLLLLTDWTEALMEVVLAMHAKEPIEMVIDRVLDMHPGEPTARLAKHLEGLQAKEKACTV